MVRPNKIFDPTLMDRQVRNESNYKYPLKYGKGGVYCFFHDNRVAATNIKTKKLIPVKREKIYLYVGKAKNLASRLNMHWGNYSNFMNKYWNDVFKNRYEKHFGFIYNLLVAIWYIDKELNRVHFEHELISRLKPIYNKN